MNVMVSKLLTTYMRLSIEGPLPHPFDVAVHGLPHGERHDPRTFQIQQWPYGQQQQPPRLATTLSFTQLCVFALMAGSVIGQEIFRQRALGQYPVMVFQPIFFAAYNTIATLVGLVLFKEIAGAGAIATFFSVFAVGLGLIVYGSRFLKSPGSAADGPGLPTAYPRRSTTFHSALSFSKWRKKDL
ncbi:hypothetical protein EV182_007338 [Spiromyces aspiralis]|uniref:Uncharacterized protein n=1 Tax=Spiromyces aspiralis TaxID=68401 RepID=A0ACC1HJY1_9FUNG|nr:hypothetical protein EV182_007338 [Spiromyces aspiralis]